MISFAIACFAFSSPQDFVWRQFEQDKLPPREFKARRTKLMAQIGGGKVIVLTTNPSHQRSNDTNFPFRPNSDFWYLTGCEAPESAAILAPDGITVDGKTVKEILFVEPKDPASELWNGVRMGPEVAQIQLGFELALPSSRFEEVLLSTQGKKWLLGEKPQGLTGLVARFWKAMESGQPGELDRGTATRTVGTMRAVKSPAELELMRKSMAATLAGHVEAIKSAEPGMREWEIKSLVEYIFAKNGCEFVAYGSIVGSGRNSCVLHYVDARKTLEKGDMMCMDVGGEYHGYASDVTRSFPVNGKFSPEQKAIYELVLRAQEAGIQACKVGGTWGSADVEARRIIGQGLVELGIVKTPAEANRYFMHGTSHSVGLDVHDPQFLKRLEPGVVLTVEPGIYIREGSPCDKKWWNIGVRIEDCILVTAEGPVNMSGSLTRSVEGIEKLMGETGLGNSPVGKVITARMHANQKESGTRELSSCLSEAILSH